MRPWPRFTLVNARLSLGGLILFAGMIGPAPVVWGQEQLWRAREGLPVGSEAERYLRVLQVAGKAPLYPWTLRGITPGELTRVLPTSQNHPWADRMDFSLDEPHGFQGGWVTPEAGMIFNSAYPFGENDGALWAGKGFTGVVRGGGYLRFGRLHLRIAPEVFWAQNGDFDLADNGLSEEAIYRDGRWPGRIDQPQRFGAEAYGRIGAGSSALHLALPGVTLGLSGVGQQWGPSLHYPLLLGNHAGGFPHVSVQTNGPLDFWAFHLNARYLAGRMDQTEWSPVQGREDRRFVTGAVLAVSPRGAQGLEIGVARFIHQVWPQGGPDRGDFLRPFTKITNEFQAEDNPGDENQLASAFMRISVPSAGLEITGEILKEDFARDLRHMLEEPDDLLAFSLGFQKIWERSKGGFVSFRSEFVSSELHHSEWMDRFRPGRGKPIPFPHYIHARVNQGHTQYGQILGSPTAYGGSGWTLGVDLYDLDGRTSLDLSRALRTDWLWSHLGTVGPGIADVIYALKLEAVRFRNGYQWTATFNPSLNLNRNVEEGNDVWNLGLGLSVKGLPW